jgi:uncharacterized protein YbaP (TraB family)
MLKLYARYFIAILWVSALVIVGVFCYQCAVDNKAFLWEIKSPNNTVYLLGSWHTLRESDYPLPQQMEQAFNNSDVLVFEIDQDLLNSNEYNDMVIEKATLTDKDSLLSILGETDYQRLRNQLSKLDMNISSFDNYDPWLVDITLGYQWNKQFGFDGNLGVEHYFDNKAKATGKETLGLETVECHIDVLDGLSIQSQKESLLQNLNAYQAMDITNSYLYVETDIITHEDIDLLYDKDIQAWKSGDLSYISARQLHLQLDNPEYFNRVVVQRNLYWLPQIESFINQSQDYLVIVGAGHMVGDDGLIKLLQYDGYSVIQE